MKIVEKNDFTVFRKYEGDEKVLLKTFKTEMV